MPEEGSNQDSQTESSAEDASKSGMYTQNQMDDIANEVRAKAKARAEKKWQEERSSLLERIESLEGKALTEQEKAIKEAKEQTAKEWEEKFTRLEQRNALRDSLLEGGLNPKRVKHALALAGEFAPDAESTEDVVKALRAEAPELFDKARFGPGDGSNAESGAPVEWTAENVEEALEGKTAQQRAEWWAKHQDEVEAYQARHETIRVVHAGKPLYPTRKG